MMTRTSIAFLRSLGRFAIATATVLAAAFMPLRAQPSQGPEWVAKVGSATISWTEFSKRYNEFLFATGAKDRLEMRESFLSSLVNEALLLHAFPAQRSAWRASNQAAIERVRHQALLAYLKDREVYAKISVTEAEARTAFARSHEQIAARHLYARTEEEAQELFALLKAGATFESLARQSFSDSTLRDNGGFVGYFSWGDMDPAFEEAAYGLKVGEVSAPVQTATGFSIIRLEDRIPDPIITESQFQQRRAHVERVVRLRKKKPSEIAYLRAVLPPDAVVFDERGLETVAKAVRRPTSEDLSVEAGAATCARVAGTTLSCSEALRMLRGLPADQRMRIQSRAALEAAIRGLMLQDRLLMIARERGYDTLDVVRSAQQRDEEKLYLRDRTREIVTSASVEEDELRRVYRRELPAFSTEHRLQVEEIIVERKDLADSLYGLLRRGGDFAEIGRAFSVRRMSGDRGGLLDEAPVSRFGAVGDPLWKATVGSLVGPIEIAGVFGIFRVVRKHEGRPRPFEEVREQVRRLVLFERQRATLTEHFEGLKRRIPVTIDHQRLGSKPVPADTVEEQRRSGAMFGPGSTSAVPSTPWERL